METLKIADKQKNPQDKFWSSDISVYRDLLIRETPEALTLKREDSNKKRYFVLQKNILLRFTNRASKVPERWVNISWKVLTISKSGFSLDSEEFLARDQQQLQKWVSSLSPRCFASGFYEDFELSSQIGQGAYAKVYSVVHKKTGKVFAAKVVDLKKLSERSLLSLKNEIKIMRRTSHPGIIRTYSIYQETDEVVFLMEMMQGGDLFRLIIKYSRIPEHIVAHFAEEMLSSLAYLEEKGIIHRDIKPENIFLKHPDSLDDFKLGDFGFACKAVIKPTLSCGSPGYVAPEVLFKQEYDCKADIFGFGIIVYIMLTGSTPFGGNTQREVLLKNRACQIIYHDCHWKRLSSKAKDFVMMLTEKNINLRPSAKEALKHPWLRDEGTPAPVHDKIKQIKRCRTAEFSNDISDNNRKTEDSGFGGVADHIKKYVVKRCK